MVIKAFFEKISSLGSNSGKYSLRQIKTIRLVNQVALIAILFCFIVTFINIFLGLYTSAILASSTGLLFFGALGLNYRKKHRSAKIFALILALLSTTIVNALVDLQSHYYYYFLTTFVLGIILFRHPKERLFILAAHLGCVIFAFIIASQLTTPVLKTFNPTIFGILNITLIMGVLYFVLSMITTENHRFEKRTVELLSSITEKNKELKQEKARTEKKAKALKITNKNLKKEVKERQKMEEALRVSNEALQQFASVASHDLKEPLRTVSSFTRLLERRLGSDMDKTSSEYFQFVIDGTQRMATLLDDLLKYSRLNNEITYDDMDLNNTIEIIQYNLRNLLERKNGVITSDKLPRFTANRSQLAQVFQNMVSNGLKFNNSKFPKVEITCEEHAEEYIFSVRDNGIGISPEYQDKVFMIFQRLHNREVYEGTGIGLAICKKVIENHNGRIWLHSTPDIGTTFFFSIPKNLLSPKAGMKTLRVMEAATVKQN